MKTYKQRMDAITQKLEQKKKQQRIKTSVVSAVSIVCAVALMCVLFTPYDRTPPDVSKFSGSEYYGLIQKLNLATYTPPRYTNNFEKWSIGALRGMLELGGGVNYAPGMDGELGGPGGEMMPDEIYQEVTDNQVEGIIEADIVKRSDRYIYHLNGDVLSVYSIAGEESATVGGWRLDGSALPKGLDEDLLHYGVADAEMYLSSDCDTLTIVTAHYHKSIGEFVLVINLDVTVPSDIRLVNSVYFEGSYNSSRMVDGELLLVCNYIMNKKQIDFEDVSTFVPEYCSNEGTEYIPAENIASPEELSSLRYTVLGKLDGNSLEVLDTAAFLSYSDTIYVSKNAVYTTRSFSGDWEKSISDYDKGRCVFTEITGVSYAGDEMALLGSVTVEGSVKDQYSLDEYEGVLRVVTSSDCAGVVPAGKDHYINYKGNNIQGLTYANFRNANLYCIDTSSWEIIGSVKAFAPDYETAQSVRFDGPNAYVCTAEVITLTDPVYFFDLTDPRNITWKDTGTIDGYSSSLIQLGDGYLLGIGYNKQRELKIEVYVETEKGVESLSVFEEASGFSEVYKAYLIDRENDLIGLGIYNHQTRSTEYLLLHFTGMELREVGRFSMEHVSLDRVRGILIDGYLYILNDTGELKVHKIW